MNNNQGTGVVISKINRTEDNVTNEDVYVSKYNQLAESDQYNMSSLNYDSINIEQSNHEEKVEISFEGVYTDQSNSLAFKLTEKIKNKENIIDFVKRMTDELRQEMNNANIKIGYICFQNHLEDEEFYYIECFQEIGEIEEEQYTRYGKFLKKLDFQQGAVDSLAIQFDKLGLEGTIDIVPQQNVCAIYQIDLDQNSINYKGLWKDRTHPEFINNILGIYKSNFVYPKYIRDMYIVQNYCEMLKEMQQDEQTVGYLSIQNQTVCFRSHNNIYKQSQYIGNEPKGNNGTTRGFVKLPFTNYRINTIGGHLESAVYKIEIKRKINKYQIMNEYEKRMLCEDDFSHDGPFSLYGPRGRQVLIEYRKEQINKIHFQKCTDIFIFFINDMLYEYEIALKHCPSDSVMNTHSMSHLQLCLEQNYFQFAQCCLQRIGEGDWQFKLCENDVLEILNDNSQPKDMKLKALDCIFLKTQIKHVNRVKQQIQISNLSEFWKLNKNKRKFKVFGTGEISVSFYEDMVNTEQLTWLKETNKYIQYPKRFRKIIDGKISIDENDSGRKIEYVTSAYKMYVHPFNKECLSFLNNLSKIEDDEFLLTQLRHIVDYYFFQSFPYILANSLCYIVYSTSLLTELAIKYKDQTEFKVTERSTLVIFNLILIVILMIRDFVDVLVKRYLFKDTDHLLKQMWGHYTDSDNVVDLAYQISYIIYAMIYLMCDLTTYDNQQLLNNSEMIYLISIFFSLIKTFCVVFTIGKGSRYIIHLVKKVLVSMIPFLIFFIATIFTFSIVFVQLFMMGENFLQGNFGSIIKFTLDLGGGQNSKYDKSDIGFIFYLISFLIVVCIQFNMLISIIGETYSRINGCKTVSDLRIKIEKVEEVIDLFIFVYYVKTFIYKVIKVLFDIHIDHDITIKKYVNFAYYQNALVSDEILWNNRFKIITNSVKYSEQQLKFKISQIQAQQRQTGRKIDDLTRSLSKLTQGEE